MSNPPVTMEQPGAPLRDEDVSNAARIHKLIQDVECLKKTISDQKHKDDDAIGRLEGENASLRKALEHTNNLLRSGQQPKDDDQAQVEKPLLDRITYLEEENAALVQENKSLAKENKSLAKEVAQLKLLEESILEFDLLPANILGGSKTPDVQTPDVQTPGKRQTSRAVVVGDVSGSDDADVESDTSYKIPETVKAVFHIQRYKTTNGKIGKISSLVKKDDPTVTFKKLSDALAYIKAQTAEDVIVV